MLIIVDLMVSICSAPEDASFAPSIDS
jgi:hypothetical protein